MLIEKIKENNNEIKKELKEINEMINKNGKYDSNLPSLKKIYNQLDSYKNLIFALPNSIPLNEKLFREKFLKKIENKIESILSKSSNISALSISENNFKATFLYNINTVGVNPNVYQYENLEEMFFEIEKNYKKFLDDQHSFIYKYLNIIIMITNYIGIIDEYINYIEKMNSEFVKLMEKKINLFFDFYGIDISGLYSSILNIMNDENIIEMEKKLFNLFNKRIFLDEEILSILETHDAKKILSIFLFKYFLL